VLALAFALATVPLAVPGALAAEGLTLTTPYPALTVSPGTDVTFNLAVETTAPARVDLSLSGVPASWTAEMHGGGFVVGAVQTDGDKSTDVRLDVTVPEDATGTTRITVTASSTGSVVTLPLDIKVEVNAGGAVTVKPDYPAQRGPANQSFTFNLSIDNGKEQDLSYNATGEGPAGWTVDVTLTGQAQAVNGTVKAGSTASVAVKITPAANTTAQTYQNAVVVTVGDEQFPIELAVEVTGSYSLVLSTPTQLLSARGPSGSATTQTFRITNTGTAPVTGVTVSVTPPTDWKVTFAPETTDSIAPGAFADIVATITPSGDAIAGDYALTFTAKGKEASATDSAEVRFTVESSIIGGLIGVVLILAAIGGLWWVFRTYGRR
jgi:uncharacterized membrane protein